MEYKDKCPFCKGENIIEANLATSHPASLVSDDFFERREHIYAEVCLNCGSIIRLFVKEPKRLEPKRLVKKRK